ncbi:Sideroflexin FSF1 [Mucor velutinosus]|uniref:Sideroflexin FSF1 n=1 Tax=Mucor velutinosus TaxID=708070 RepID=A0AAN7DNL3_9FUNG|nr:Sideroflexin FSF1 [Mucor velutinosus]
MHYHEKGSNNKSVQRSFVSLRPPENKHTTKTADQERPDEQQQDQQQDHQQQQWRRKTEERVTPETI